MASKKNHHHPVDHNQQPAGTVEPGPDAGAVPGKPAPQKSQRRHHKIHQDSAQNNRSQNQDQSWEQKQSPDRAFPLDKRPAARLDAAAKVLQEAGRSLNWKSGDDCRHGGQGLLVFPSRRTPAATL